MWFEILLIVVAAALALAWWFLKPLRDGQQERYYRQQDESEDMYYQRARSFVAEMIPAAEQWASGILREAFEQQTLEEYFRDYKPGEYIDGNLVVERTEVGLRLKVRGNAKKSFVYEAVEARFPELEEEAIEAMIEAAVAKDETLGGVVIVGNDWALVDEETGEVLSSSKDEVGADEEVELFSEGEMANAAEHGTPAVCECGNPGEAVEKLLQQNEKQPASRSAVPLTPESLAEVCVKLCSPLGQSGLADDLEDSPTERIDLSDDEYDAGYGDHHDDPHYDFLDDESLDSEDDDLGEPEFIEDDEPALVPEADDDIDTISDDDLLSPTEELILTLPPIPVEDGDDELPDDRPAGIPPPPRRHG